MDYQKSTKGMSHAVQLCHQLVPPHTHALAKEMARILSPLAGSSIVTATSGTLSTLLQILETLRSTAVIN